MEVELISNTPLLNIIRAARKCHASEANMDSQDEQTEWGLTEILGTSDKKLIQDVIIGRDHTSVLEHLFYTFDIDGLSRAALQELVRHRHASMSVKSTRYTLKELKKDGDLKGHELVKKYCVIPPWRRWNVPNRMATGAAMERVREAVIAGVPNDHAKYLLPESFKTSLIWSINARSLRNFFKLRSSSAALWEMQELASCVYEQLPEDHRFLYEDCLQYRLKEWAMKEVA